MSPSLLIDCEWIDQPSALDALERLTWARISISVAGRSATRIWDRESGSAKTGLYIPLFPIATWIVRNWWALIEEGLVSEKVPLAGNPMPHHQKEWIYRHCMRTAEVGMLLPRLYFFQSGQNTILQWFAERSHQYKHMPGYFLEGGMEVISKEDLKDALGEFIHTVVDRIRFSADARALAFIADWQAIIKSDAEEIQFCKYAAIMGLDPYATSAWPENLVDLLEKAFEEEPNKLLVGDFLDVIQPDQAVSKWEWVKLTEQRLIPNPSKLETQYSRDFDWISPATFGYRLAQKVRSDAAVGQKPILSMENLFRQLEKGTLSLKSDAMLAESPIKAMAGQAKDRHHFEITSYDRPPNNNRRFLEARGLYHAFGTPNGAPRLITAGHSWDQKASRAFAAELLLPGNIILARLDGKTRSDDAFEAALAQEFQVSKRIVELQLENSNITPWDLLN